MLALYLDYELNADERVDVELAVGEPIDLLRLPWLFPLRTAPADEGRGFPIEPKKLLPHLERAGVSESQGRILLIAPQEVRWYANLAAAILLRTGHYPLLVQPAARRDELGCAGPLRVIDMEAYMKGEEAETLPPWLLDDENPLAPDD